VANINATSINLDELFGSFTSKEQIKESFDKITAPTGRYVFTATKVEPLTGGADHPLESLRNRPHVHVFGKLTETLPDGTIKRRGSVGFDASWERRATPTGQPDGASKLWGQLCRAFGMEQASVGEVVNALSHYPVSAYVRESFKTPDSTSEKGYKWVTTRDQAIRSEYRRSGFDARNFVDSVSKA
jgi:hypothetical protein